MAALRADRGRLISPVHQTTLAAIIEELKNFRDADNGDKFALEEAKRIPDSHDRKILDQVMRETREVMARRRGY